MQVITVKNRAMRHIAKKFNGFKELEIFRY